MGVRRRRPRGRGLDHVPTGWGRELQAAAAAHWLCVPTWKRQATSLLSPQPEGRATVVRGRQLRSSVRPLFFFLLLPLSASASSRGAGPFSAGHGDGHQRQGEGGAAAARRGGQESPRLPRLLLGALRVRPSAACQAKNRRHGRREGGREREGRSGPASPAVRGPGGLFARPAETVRRVPGLSWIAGLAALAALPSLSADFRGGVFEGQETVFRTTLVGVVLDLRPQGTFPPPLGGWFC